MAFTGRAEQRDAVHTRGKYAADVRGKTGVIRSAVPAKRGQRRAPHAAGRAGHRTNFRTSIGSAS